MYAINWALENSLGNKMKVTLGEDYGELGERHNAGSVVIWCSRLWKTVNLAWPVV